MMRLAFRTHGKVASLGALMLVALASAITLVFLLEQLEDQAWWSKRWMRGPTAANAGDIAGRGNRRTRIFADE